METIVGTLLEDPEIRYMRGGVAKCSLVIGAGARWHVTCTGTLAENVALSLAKGHGAIVYGTEGHADETCDECGHTEHKSTLVAVAVGPSLTCATADIITTRRRGES